MCRPSLANTHRSAQTFRRIWLAFIFGLGAQRYLLEWIFLNWSNFRFSMIGMHCMQCADDYLWCNLVFVLALTITRSWGKPRNIASIFMRKRKCNKKTRPTTRQNNPSILLESVFSFIVLGFSKSEFFTRIQGLWSLARHKAFDISCFDYISSWISKIGINDGLWWKIKT